MGLSYRITKEDIFENIECIHPLMQKTVSELVNWCKQFPNIVAVAVFGSSTRESCNYESDCDVYIEGGKQSDFFDFNPSRNTPMDIFVSGDVVPGSEFAKEILKTGVLVYERDSNK